MKIAISQPTFLPWQGYIALIGFVDEFVILDDVQFDKRSWQQRNLIKHNDNAIILTVPVLSKEKSKQKINEVRINYNDKFVKKHLASIYFAYKKSKFFNLYYEKIESIYNTNYVKLIDINLAFINFILSEIKIKTKISLSSELKLNYNKHLLIDEICKVKKCKNYISTLGAKKYLDKLKSETINYDIKYFKFKSTEYKQLGQNFIPNLSFLDLLFNVGDNCKKYLDNNFYLIN